MVCFFLKINDSNALNHLIFEVPFIRDPLLKSSHHYFLGVSYQNKGNGGEDCDSL